MARFLKKIRAENLLLVITVLGVILGVALGLALKLGIDGEPTMTPRNLQWLQMPGTIFLRALKLLILPLITSSLINSLVTLDPSTAGKVGFYSLIYYMVTTLTAVVTGIIMVLIIRPGYGSDQSEHSGKVDGCIGTVPTDTIMDLMRNMVPDNIVEATFQSESGCVRYVRWDANHTKETINDKAWDALNDSMICFELTQNTYLAVEALVEEKNA